MASSAIPGIGARCLRSALIAAIGCACPFWAIGQEGPSMQRAGDIVTRNATFKVSRFSDLPGWGQDKLESAGAALRGSCAVLGRRESWATICTELGRLGSSDPVELRRLFEAQFTLFRIVDPDESDRGTITGYYEPLVDGSLTSSASFGIPVYATPNDLYLLDWRSIPESKRRSLIHVESRGTGRLTYVEGSPAGSYALDAASFVPDARDRDWRLRLVGANAQRYRSRADIDALDSLDAPVLAYVGDRITLYALQVQGSGRIRLRDGTILRVQYAQQNGHPFRPMRLVSKTPERVRTRGIASPSEEAESFELETPPVGDRALTRGLGRTAAQRAGDDAATEALVDELLRNARREPSVKPSPALPQAQPQSLPQPQSRQTSGTKAALTSISDPSYVFFRAAPDQSPKQGPIGALGVALTPTRSIAVDPRVIPLGYPVYLSAPPAGDTALPMQRLVLAQDTGGAIRGAVRADFFWGSGVDAGRQALRTGAQGHLWVMLPNSEVDAMRQRTLTRGIGTKDGAVRLNAECLVADDRSCTEP